MDYYLTASSMDDLTNLSTGFSTVLGPSQGVAAVAPGTDESGNPTQGIPAKGDPTLFYVAIRAPEGVSISSPTGVTDISANNSDGVAVLGVWA